MKKFCKTCQYGDNKLLIYDVYENHLRGSIIEIYPLINNDICFFFAFDDKLEEKNIKDD